jgi:hypothetical protein
VSRQPQTAASRQLLAYLTERRDACRRDAAEHHEAGAHGMGHVSSVWADCYDRVLADLPRDLVVIEDEAAGMGADGALEVAKYLLADNDLIGVPQ